MQTPITSPAISTTAGALSAAISLASFSQGTYLAAQVAGAGPGDVFALWAATQSGLSSTTQMAPVPGFQGAVDAQGNITGWAGPVPVEGGTPVRTNFVYIQRIAGTTAGLTAVFNGQETPGTQTSNGAAASSVSYRPGGVPGNGIYTTFPAAFAAAVAIAPLAPKIVVDPSFGSPVIPSGTYALPAMLTIVGLQFATLTIQDGAHFTVAVGTEATLGLDGIALNNASTTAPCISVASGETLFLQLDEGSTIESDVAATKAFVSVASGGNVFASCGLDGTLSGSASAAIVSAAGGSNVTTFAFNFSSVGSDTFTGAGTISITSDPTVSVDPTQTGATNLTLYQPAATLLRPALTLSAAGGAQSLPTRPSTLSAPSPSCFLATPSGNQAAQTTYTLPMNYQPNDIVRILFTHTQMNGANVLVVDGGAGTPQIAALLVASTGASGSAHVDCQLNAAGTHWTSLGGGYL